MRTAVYGRLSIERGGRESENVGIQVQECSEYSSDQGWQVVGVFTDQDISASRYSKKPRLGYNQLIEAVRSNEVDVIVITEMPRLYRRLEELLELMHLAEATSLKRIETTDGLAYDLSTGFGIHNAVAAVNTAVFESRKTSDRLKRKRRAEAQAGRPNGGIRPYGYEKGGMVVRESEAAVIRDTVARLLAGQSMRSIIIDLNARGVPTPSGKGLWHPHRLRQIIRGKRIIGVRSHKGLEYPAQWPAIITREDWERVQLLFETEERTAGASAKGVRSYLLSGMTHCGLCGNRLVSSGLVHDKTGTFHRKYRCRTINAFGVKTGCGKIARVAEPVERLVAEAVLYRYDSEDIAKAFSDAAVPEMGGLLETYTEQKSRLDNLIADYASGLLNREQLAQAKAIVEEALEATREKMAKLESGRTLASVPLGQTIREAWRGGDLFWRRNLISLIVDKVILQSGRAGGKKWQDPESGRVWQFDPTKVEIVWKV